MDSIPRLLKDLSKAWIADIWLEDTAGRTISSGTDEPRPGFPAGMEKLGNSGIYRDRGGPPSDYLMIKLEDGKTVYIRQHHGSMIFEDVYFMAGLALITLVVGLILFPVSKRITDPLNRLTESANAISRGEFDLKVDETSYFEIAELAKAFNRMSEKLLQMINGTKELTANISHQIRSPLARISVTTELIRKNISSGDTNGIEEKLLSIENEIDHMNVLTGRIIELMRVDIAHKNTEYMDIDLKKTAVETEMKYIDMIRKKEIISSIDETPGLYIIPGIQRDFYELFEILYDNAVRYSAEKGFIKLVFSMEDGKTAIKLSNTCPAMSGVISRNLFEPFTGGSSQGMQGHGLGLAIAGRIVKNHGGEISAEYTGSAFGVKITFNLPSNNTGRDT
jgi:two-component system sensor histidine kinase CpxA